MSLDGETSAIIKDKAESCDEKTCFGSLKDDKNDYEGDAESTMSAEEGENDNDKNDDNDDHVRDGGIQKDCVEDPLDANPSTVSTGETVRTDRPNSNSSTHYAVEAEVHSFSEGQAPLNNDLFIKTYRKLKSYPKTGVSLANHPMAPKKDTFNMSSLTKKMKTTMIKYRSLARSSYRAKGKEELKEFLLSFFQFPTRLQPHLYSAASISDEESDVDHIHERGNIDWNENQAEANQDRQTEKMDSSNLKATDSLLEGEAALTNNLVVETYKKFNDFQKTGESLMRHPMAPKKGTFNETSLVNKMRSTMHKYKRLVRNGSRPKNKEDLKEFLQKFFHFPFSTQPQFYSAATISDEEGDADDLHDSVTGMEGDEIQAEADLVSSVRAGDTDEMDCSNADQNSSVNHQASEATNSLLEGEAALTNDLFVETYKKLKSFHRTGEALMRHPMAPKKGTFCESSLGTTMKRNMNKYRNLWKSSKRPRGKEELDEFLEESFKFPIRSETHRKGNFSTGAINANLDSVENLLIANETVDAELRQWAVGVEKGFQERETDEARECERIEKEARERLNEVKELKEKTAKMREKYERVTEEADKDEQLQNSTALKYREWQENIKKDLKQPSMIGETESLLKEIQRIRDEKLKAQWSNDDMERSNQDLRESVFELAGRCLECRVGERANSKLKPKTKKMFRELLALGIPLKSVNVVVSRVLGDLGEFKVVGLPTLEEIETLSAEYDDDEDDGPGVSGRWAPCPKCGTLLSKNSIARHLRGAACKGDADVGEASLSNRGGTFVHQIRGSSADADS